MWYWVITATGCDICPLFKAKERYQGSPINNPVVAKASRWCCRSDPHSCWSLWKFSCAFRVSASSFRCGRVQGLDTKSTEAVDARLRALAGKVRSGGAAAGAGPRPGHRAGGFVVPSRGRAPGGRGRRGGGARGVSLKQQRRKMVGGSAWPAATRVRLDLRLSRFQERLSVR